jgi:hypothetical protein
VALATGAASAIVSLPVSVIVSWSGIDIYFIVFHYPPKANLMLLSEAGAWEGEKLPFASVFPLATCVAVHSLHSRTSLFVPTFRRFFVILPPIYFSF